MILNEDAIFSKTCKNPVYIVLMNGKSPLSSIILSATGDYFSHACIAFNDSLDPLYSFGLKSKAIQKGGMGFCVSKPTDLTVFNKQAYYAVYVTYVTDEAYAKMKERLSYFTKNASKMIYDYIGLLNVWMHQSSDHRTRAYFCSRFVMDVIGAGVKLDKLPSLYRPQDIANMDNITLVNRGYDFYNYDKKITQKNEKLLKKGKLNTDDIIFEDVSSVLQKDFQSKHDMNLSSFEKMRLSDAAIQVYGKKIPSLSHVRINNNTKGYIWIDKKTDMPVAIVNVEEKDDGFSWIQAFEIFTPYKGHGLSKDILNVAIRDLKATNLSVNKDNQVAIKIYKSYGFKTYKTTESMYFMSIDKNAFDDEDDDLDESALMESSLPFKLYHGSRYLFDELRPFGIDFGNSFQDPGRSLFTWTKHTSAMGWGCWEVFRHLRKIDDKIVLIGCLNSQTTVLWQSVYNYLKENIHKYSEEDLSFYIYTIPTRSEYKYGLGHSSNTPNCITIRTDHIKYSEVNKYILTIDLVDKYCKIVPDGYKPTGKECGSNKRLASFFMKYDYMYQREVKKNINNAIKNGEISPGDDISVFLKDNNIDLKTINFKERLDDIISDESSIQEEALEIQGETGFYDKHNRWNPMVIINGENYRHRVECLIMCQNKLFVAESNNGNLLVPGGGVDKSLSDEEQVYNECKEEARILVKDIKPTGYSYIRRTGVSQSARNLPKEQQWVGSYTEVYIANYMKDFTGFIDYCDRDSEMIRGRFRGLADIDDRLLPEWKAALIDANYISIATESIKSYKDPKLALKRRMGIKRNNAIKLGDFSGVVKAAPTPQAQTVSVPSPAVSSSAPSNSAPAKQENTEEIPDNVKENANRLLCKEIAAYPKYSGHYYNMDYPLYNGQGHAIVGWKMTGVHYNDFDTFNKYRDHIYEYCSKIFSDTNPGYKLNMDKKTNCIYISEV